MKLVQVNKKDLKLKQGADISKCFWFLVKGVWLTKSLWIPDLYVHKVRYGQFQRYWRDIRSQKLKYKFS